MQTPKKGTERSILIVDDHSEVRHALKWLIDREFDFSVRAVAGSFDRALRIIKGQSFDLAIVDISLNGSSGLELAQLMKSRRPEMRIVIFSAHDDLSYVERAFRSGVQGYLVKSSDTAEEILTAIRHVLDGGVYVSGRITQELSANDIKRISTAWAGEASQ